MYLPGKDKVVFADDYSVGARNDLRGMLLLDTALQTPVNKPEDQIKVEIPLAEVRKNTRILNQPCKHYFDNVKSFSFLFSIQNVDKFKCSIKNIGSVLCYERC